MTEEYKEELQKLLWKLFQIESAADLDFGIYRIMNHKREEIKKFIKKDLIDAVDSEFVKYSAEQRQEIEKELEKIKEKVKKTLGKEAFDKSGEIKRGYENFPIVKDYQKKKQQLDEIGITEQQKAEIFSHIYHFFSRYYDKGDFLSLRRYSEDNKYVIPYNGEEVLLHWANKDQYYIKTDERFYNYSFNVGDYRIKFKISNAEVEKNNNKTESRYFVLKNGDNITYDPDNKELTILFEYKGITDEEKRKYGKKNVQSKIVESVGNEILKQIEDKTLKKSLQSSSDEKKSLRKHLNKYTKRNKSDYFIHKNLKGFLEEELDFYIKNEVLNMDDLRNKREADVRDYMRQVGIIKKISEKIIDFLAQIEEFQKKLWEKKKFVLQTDYCMTLDKVPEEFYEEIAQNEEQIKEWKELFKLEEVEKGTLTYSANGGLKIDVDYLKNNPYLVLDTKFFDQDFKDRLMASFDNLDDEIEGVMIKSENWQALNLLQEKYGNKVKCCYIDPPFNSAATEILYKNDYKHSSWLTLMADRISKTKGFLNNEGVFINAIDENEQERLGLLLEYLFPTQDYDRTCITIIHNPGGIQGQNFSYTHEYTYFIYPNSGRYIALENREDSADVRTFMNTAKGNTENYLRFNAPNCFYPIYVKNGEIVGFGDVCDETFHPSPNIKRKDGVVEVYPVDSDGEERKWVFARQSVEDVKDELIPKYNERKKLWEIIRKKTKINYKTVWTDKKYNAKTYGTNLLNNIFGASNAKFTFPKSLYNIYECVRASTHEDEYGIVLDYFAGSGTTGHAVMDLNRDDDGKRKYIMVEMGDYFDSIMKPRIQKIMFSKDWKNGMPQNKDGHSHMFKYQYLEQYEDALNNIVFKDTKGVQKTLDKMGDYFLNYMLDFETQGSPTRLDIDKLSKPFDYKLEITNQNNEIEHKKVDLVETFNYLLGLHVDKMKTFDNNGTHYKVIFGRKNGKNIVVIWRNLDDLDLKEDKEFVENTILNGYEPDTVYVNGDNHLGARPIEPELKKLMGE